MREDPAETVPLMTDLERQENGRAEAHPDAPISDSDRAHTENETPRFIEDEGTWKRWKWIPYPVRRYTKATVRWAKGPEEPQILKIKPFFPKIQEAPLRLLDRFLPKHEHRVWVYISYISIWLVTFALVLRQGTLSTEVAGWGLPNDITCGTTYWVSDNKCGIDGNDCRPFNGSGFAFKCPANCASYQVLNPRAVGDQELIYQNFIVGGPADPNSDENPFYRGDSFICPAAIHAGIVSDSKGGCGVVKLVGRNQNYVGSERHGLKSVGFDSYFPLTFTFEEGVECDSRDVRWSLLAISVVFTTVLSLLTASPGVFFFTVFIGVYWQTGLATDPPTHATVADLISVELGRFLPAMFCAWVFYDKMGIRRTLDGLTAQIEKTILWLGACWVGALDNYTLSFIPIQRLTGHDLQQQPGAKAALTFIVLLLIVVFVSQVWYFRQEGRLIRHLKLYVIFVIGILVCLVLPDLHLRIHHYILALLLLPGTSLQTRPSLLYQGLLVGLFINGIARWGFDPVLQTAWALQGDAQLNSPLPVLLAPAISLNQSLSSITFKWEASPGPMYDGISVLVNDVERYRSFFADEGSDQFVWTRHSDLGLDEYFRFGYMEGSDSVDYTKAGKWTAAGDWVAMQPGPSRIKDRGLDVEERPKLSK